MPKLHGPNTIANYNGGEDELVSDRVMGEFSEASLTIPEYTKLSDAFTLPQVGKPALGSLPQHERLLEALRLFGEPDPYASKYLDRGVYNLDLSDLLRSMLSPEDTFPLLTSNYLRTKLSSARPELRFELLLEHLDCLAGEIKDDPVTFSDATVDQTRVSVKSQEKREAAKGVLFFRVDEVNSVGSIGALAYALDAFERQLPSRQEDDLCSVVPPTKDRAIYYFRVENSQGCNLEGDCKFEVVVPGVVPNKDIKQVIVGVNLQGIKWKKMMAQYLHLERADCDKVVLRSSAAGLEPIGLQEKGIFHPGEIIGGVRYLRDEDRFEVDVKDAAIASALETLVNRGAEKPIE